jgi:uncharacterized membrane protein
MSDPTQPTPAPSPMPSEQPGPQMSAGEVQDGKVFAILCYVINILGFPFWLVPLILRNNDFALYHAKQCLMLWIFGVIGGIVGTVLIPVFCIGAVILGVVIVAMLVFNIIGLINALNGLTKPLPLIGPYAERWFASLRKAV